MVEKTVYVANDGKVFESEEKCRMHETSDLFSAAKKYIHLMNSNGIIRDFDCWEELEKVIECYAYYITIDDDIDKNLLRNIDDFLKSYYGLYAHLPSNSGEYRWNEEEEEWISYEEDFKKFSHNWRHRRG